MGSDGVTSLPPYRFDYSFRAATRGLSGTFEPSFTAPPSCNPAGGHYAADPPGGVIATIADMNRDGLGDRYQIESEHIPVDGAVFVGARRRTPPALGVGPAVRPVRARNTVGVAATCSFSEKNGGSAVMDFDGDGYLDHLFASGFPYEVTPRLRLGSAAGFVEPPLQTSFDLEESSLFGASNTVFDRTYIRIAGTNGTPHVDVIAAMADVTADGRPDLVITPFRAPYDYPGWASWTGWAVFVNRGLASDSGGTFLDFGYEPTRWIAPPLTSIQHDFAGFASHALLADQNGDGLADRVLPGAVEYGYGAGFLAQESVASVTASLARQHDLHGDRHLRRERRRIPRPRERAVHQRHEPELARPLRNRPRLRCAGEVVPGRRRRDPTRGASRRDGQNAVSSSLRDMNGDGVPDRLRYGGGVMLNAGALDPNAAIDPELPSAALPGLLLRATDPLGGVVEFSYQTAPQLRDAAGLPANPGFSLARPVVTRVTIRDGRAGTPAPTTLYAYADGVFDYAEKEFRGFGTVIATQIEDGAAVAKTTATYRTDRDCAFSPATVETAQGASVLARESTSYAIVTGGGAGPDAWTRCLPVTRIQEAVEGDEAAKRTRRTSFFYGSPIDANYNLARLEEWGEWNPSANQDVPGDERITEYAYATPSSAFPSIVSRVKLETTKDAAGNVYAKRQTCYFSAGCSVAGSGRPVVIKAISHRLQRESAASSTCRRRWRRSPTTRTAIPRSTRGRARPTTRTDSARRSRTTPRTGRRPSPLPSARTWRCRCGRS